MTIYEPHHEKTRLDSNWLAQLQRLARVFKFRIWQEEVLHYPGSEQQSR